MSSFKLNLSALVKLLRDERGDSLVNWVVLAIGLALAATALAIVASGERNAPAISGVRSPPSNLSVSAT